MTMFQQISTSKLLTSFILIITCSFTGFSQDSDSPFVNYDQFEALVKEVRQHRKDRLLPLDDFNDMSKKEGVVILDTRSKEMYDLKHIKGAVHLNFSDFTQASLDALFGSRDVTILIYCNNNIEEHPIRLSESGENSIPSIETLSGADMMIDPEYFASKVSRPEIKLEMIDIDELKDDRGAIETETPPVTPITLALNIPTYINLFGYGYKNVYELKDLVSVFDERIAFEGSAVQITN